MESVTFNGHYGDYFRLTLEEIYGFPDSTSPFGGYDTQSTIEIKSGSYYTLGNVWITTGNIYSLYEQLLKCQKSISGVARFDSYENNLQVFFEYDSYGHVEIKGAYQEDHTKNTKLQFEIISDQSFIDQSIISLEQIYLKYGNNNGVKGKIYR